jgi:undecaprenyl diphosphate synthase
MSSKTQETSKFKNLPNHVAIIVDGNRRWARKKKLPDIVGHKQVTDNILEPIIYRCLELKISYITFWAFSTENWKRGKKFSTALFKLLGQGLKKSIEKYEKAGMRLKTIGDLSKLPRGLVNTINQWVEKSRRNKKITVTIALNYGGRDEIIRAVNKLLKTNRKKKITEKVFSQSLDTKGLPDPDLIIRTGGSQRTSGFLIWQGQYAELYFTDVLMPDFTVREFEKGLKEYGQRQRRFGK